MPSGSPKDRDSSRSRRHTAIDTRHGSRTAVPTRARCPPPDWSHTATGPSTAEGSPETAQARACAPAPPAPARSDRVPAHSPRSPAPDGPSEAAHRGPPPEVPLGHAPVREAADHPPIPAPPPRSRANLRTGSPAPSLPPPINWQAKNHPTFASATKTCALRYKDSQPLRSRAYRGVPQGGRLRTGEFAPLRSSGPETGEATARGENDDRRSHSHPLVEIDHVLVGHADAAGRYRTADVFRLVGAVDAIQRVLAPLVEIDRSCPQGIGRTAGDARRVRAEPGLDLRGRNPVRPLRHLADAGHARPRHRFLADRDAVADRLAARHDQVKKARIGIDDDHAWRLGALIGHDVPAGRVRKRASRA